MAATTGTHNQGMRVPRGVILPDLTAPLDTFARGTRSYLLVTTVFGLIVAALDAGILWWAGG